MDCSLPGSSVHGIFQAVVLEWIAISFSRGSSQPRDQTRVSCIVDRRFTSWEWFAVEKMRGLPVSVSGGLGLRERKHIHKAGWVSTAVLVLRSELVDILWGLLLISQWKVNLRQKQGVRSSCWSVCNNVWLKTSFSQWKQILKLATCSKKRNYFPSLTQDWILCSFGGQAWLNLFKYVVLCLDSQSCPALCISMDCSLPGSSVHGILQTRILEWVAMSSRGSSQPSDRTQVSHIVDRFFQAEPQEKNLFSFGSNIYFYGLLFHIKKISFLSVLWFESC